MIYTQPKMEKKEATLSQISIGINAKDVDRLTKDLMGIIDGKEINTANVLSIVAQLMIAVGKYQNLSGSQKKELVIYVLKSFIGDSSDINADTKSELLVMFDWVIPSAIDLLVAASKSTFAFKIKKKLFSCCK